MMSWAKDFLNLLLPDACPVCGKALIKNERIICFHCLYDLPVTRFQDFHDNPVARLFWGRVRLEYACSWFHYQKGSSYQKLIHSLKYRGRTDLGTELGRLMGQWLRKSPLTCAEVIVPVPLHPRKERRRGYNQSDYIGQGLSFSLGIPFLRDPLERIHESHSQSGKSSMHRWENVEKVFRVIVPGKLENRHVLLVDDVVTTGATLDACATEILKLEGTRVSIATLAFTGKLY